MNLMTIHNCCCLSEAIETPENEKSKVDESLWLTQPLSFVREIQSIMLSGRLGKSPVMRYNGLLSEEGVEPGQVIQASH